MRVTCVYLCVTTSSKLDHEVSSVGNKAVRVDDGSTHLSRNICRRKSKERETASVLLNIDRHPPACEYHDGTLKRDLPRWTRTTGH